MLSFKIAFHCESNLSIIRPRCRRLRSFCQDQSGPKQNAHNDCIKQPARGRYSAGTLWLRPDSYWEVAIHAANSFQNTRKYVCTGSCDGRSHARSNHRTKIRISIVTIFRFCDEMFFKQLVVKFDVYNRFVPQRHLNPRSTSAFATSGAAPSRATITHSTDGNWLLTFSRCFSTWFSTCP